jgi:tetratricopeptide (TPR) repeat protein
VRRCLLVVDGEPTKIVLSGDVTDAKRTSCDALRTRMRSTRYDRRVSCRGRSAIVVAIILMVTWVLTASVIADPLVDALGTDDPSALSAAIAVIESEPASPELADALFAAARACEDRLHDPARALALYDRITREMPDARVAIAASRRAAMLRTEVGPSGEHAARAKRLAELIASAQTASPDVVFAEANVLANEPWPGAVDAALFLAEMLRRTGRHAEAQAAFARVVERWPTTPQSAIAIRGGAGNAIEARDWELAVKLAHDLPITDPADEVLREDLLDAVARGKFRARLYGAAWIAFVLGAALLVASLAEAIIRARRAPPLAPPIEVLFLAPFGGLLVAIAYIQNMPVASSVAQLTVGALAMTWLSGSTLDLVRGSGQAVRVRAIGHAVAVAAAALALGYISLVRAGLLDVIAETVRYGPGA